MSEAEQQAQQELQRLNAAMRALFEERMALAAAEVAAPGGAGKPADVQQADMAALYADFERYTDDLARQYRQRVANCDTVAYQGVEGGFGHQVAGQLFAHGTLLGCPTFADVFDAVAAGSAAFGVVPFENSNTGDVTGVVDLCFSHNLYVVGMVDLPVHQNLLGLPGAKLGDVRRVYSHVQALQQSKRFLDALGAEQIPYPNTAQAARFVAEQRDASLAAVASLEAGETYGLVPLARDISTAVDNTTRFIVISREARQGGNRFSLLVSIRNTVGSLGEIIRSISQQGFDMENIKSRPMPGSQWEYYFYIELVGAPDSQATRLLLEDLQRVCLQVRLLGSYTRGDVAALLG